MKRKMRDSVTLLYGKIPPIVGVLLLAAFLRLALPLAAYARTGDSDIFLGPDTGSYITPARELLTTGQFTSHGEPDISRTPGYPLLLMIGLACGNLIATTLGLQILLSCASVYLVYRIAQLSFERSSAAIWAARLYTIEPLSIFYVSKLLSETLFTFLMLLFLYVFLQYTRNHRGKTLLLAAVLLATSAYVRPIAYYLPLYSMLIFGLLLFYHSNKKALILHGLLLLVVSTGLLKIWQIRNRAVSGYGGFSVISAKNLFFYNGAAVEARLKNASYSDTRARLWKTYGEPVQKASPEQRAAIYRDWDKRGKELIFDHPLLYAKIHLTGMIRMLADPGATPYLKIFNLYPEYGGNFLSEMVDQGTIKAMIALSHKNPLVFWSNMLLGLLLGLYDLLAISAMTDKRFWKSSSAPILVFFAGYFIILSGGPVGFHRYRHPIMPFISLWGGYGLALWSARLSRPHILKRTHNATP